MSRKNENDSLRRQSRSALVNINIRRTTVIDQLVWQTNTWTAHKGFGIAVSLSVSAFKVAPYHCFRRFLYLHHSLARIAWGTAIFPRKYSHSVILERQYILGSFAATAVFPGDEISCANGSPQVTHMYVTLRSASDGWREQWWVLGRQRFTTKVNFNTIIYPWVGAWRWLQWYRQNLPECSKWPYHYRGQNNSFCMCGRMSEHNKKWLDKWHICPVTQKKSLLIGKFSQATKWAVVNFTRSFSFSSSERVTKVLTIGEALEAKGSKPAEVVLLFLRRDMACSGCLFWACSRTLLTLMESAPTYPLVTEVLHASYSVHKLAWNFAPQLVDRFLAAFLIARAVQSWHSLILAIKVTLPLLEGSIVHSTLAGHLASV